MGIWTLSKQEIIAVLAYTIDPNSWYGESAKAQQRNVVFDIETGEIFATNGRAILMIGEGIIPRGKPDDTVIVPREALDWHRTRAKKPDDRCTIEIVDQKIHVMSMGETKVFDPFDRGFPPIHSIFGYLDLSEQTGVAGLPIAELESLGKIARAIGEKYAVFAGAKDPGGLVVFSMEGPKTKRWTVLLTPMKGCEVLADRLKAERAEIERAK